MNPQKLSDISRIILHHSASPRDTTTIEDIRRWHVVDRGFDDVGYHFVIEGDGKVRVGRPLDCAPAAQKGANNNTIAICIVGNNVLAAEKFGWNDSQKLSAVSLIVMLRTVFGKRLPFFGHRDVAPSECPGLEVRDVFPELL